MLYYLCMANWDHTEYTKWLNELLKVQRDMATHVRAGTLNFEEVSAGVRALLITRILHPELADILDRPEEFSGPGLPEPDFDTPTPSFHARLHTYVLENAEENDDAAGALYYLLSEAQKYHEESADALHVALHVLMMIQLQQIWGASVAAQGEGKARKRQGEAALEESNRWFTKVSKWHVKKLPRFLREILRHVSTHPWQPESY